MKKFLAILLVLMLIGTMMTATAVTAANADSAETGEGTTVLIMAKAGTGGQIAMSDDGTAPVFVDGEHDTNDGGNFPIGSTVAFSAKADEGYKFFYWLNEDTNDIYSEDSTIYIEVAEPLNLKAVFDLDVERVLIIAEALSGGRVGISDDGNDPETFGGNAGGNFPIGDSVIFSAKADEGYKFICWMVKDTEELYSTEQTITVTAEKDMTLQAAFDLDVERVVLKVNTEGKGHIAYNDDGGDPEFDPEAPLDNAVIQVVPGDTVAVAAKADEGYKFVGWKDAATGKTVSTEAQYAVTVDKDMEIIAVFKAAESGNKDNSEPNNGNTSKTSPKTGDPLPMVVLLMTVSFIGIAASVFALTKKRKNEV